MLDVRQQQLLVLLLVLDAGVHQEAEPFEIPLAGAADQLLHPSVHRFAEAIDLLGGGARHHAAMIAGDARTQRLVVGVEDVFEPGAYPAKGGLDLDYREGKRQAERVFFTRAPFPVVAARVPDVVAVAAEAADAPEDYVSALRARPCRSTGL